MYRQKDGYFDSMYIERVRKEERTMSELEREGKRMGEREECWGQELQEEIYFITLHANKIELLSVLCI